MNKIIGIAVTLASFYFLMDSGFTGTRLFTLMGAVKFLLHALFYLFAAYAGVRLIASSSNK
ncbi:MAG: hypothetical protein A2942_03905 [Candidatus Lloydbacteria bacterium RIFCSPLOWO2_01_FULL_50_20]|uniref:Uncharacterized protein n=1 Tax=Candidatus Lloydbacteria bacterium RIFCSPLOWO2_01_FULL_50_20 TaxID=1798665 RepID=A0A1G2DGZ4_9BACT|nr:MAG: hypothetical protein A3C13_04270 [Candidatus Lloydbacteria bacterium RIFCSPHIGHO2_02_FULL_50_11]OGZ12231.1 MAG: hypothetical protein A2942_03905 [Candidatus Lloydbacteria bacterium RIFCSPLOWO2_01_FULL_50_20]